MIDNGVELLQGDEPVLVCVKNSEYLLQFRLGCSVTHHRDDEEELRELDMAAVIDVVQVENVRLQFCLISPGITLVHDLTEGVTVDGASALGGAADPVVVLQH